MIYTVCNISPLQLQQKEKKLFLLFETDHYEIFFFKSCLQKYLSFKKSVFFSLLVYAQVAGLNGTCCYMLEYVKRAKGMTWIGWKPLYVTMTGFLPL